MFVIFYFFIFFFFYIFSHKVNGFQIAINCTEYILLFLWRFLMDSPISFPTGEVVTTHLSVPPNLYVVVMKFFAELLKVSPVSLKEKCIQHFVINIQNHVNASISIDFLRV
jgi:hypothetical protein